MKEELLLKLIEMLMKSESTEKQDSLVGKPVIVRCRDAGVHFGYYVSHSGREVVLERSRRVYRWISATQMTLSAVAEFGLNLGRMSELKIQNELAKITLLDACEIIPCSNVCVDSFSRVEPYNEQ